MCTFVNKALRMVVETEESFIISLFEHVCVPWHGWHEVSPGIHRGSIVDENICSWGLEASCKSISEGLCANMTDGAWGHYRGFVFGVLRGDECVSEHPWIVGDLINDDLQDDGVLKAVSCVWVFLIVSP